MLCVPGPGAGSKESKPQRGDALEGFICVSQLSIKDRCNEVEREESSVNLEARFHEPQLVELTFSRGRETAALYLREHQMVLTYQRDGEFLGALTTNSSPEIARHLRDFLLGETKQDKRS